MGSIAPCTIAACSSCSRNTTDLATSIDSAKCPCAKHTQAAQNSPSLGSFRSARDRGVGGGRGGCGRAWAPRAPGAPRGPNAPCPWVSSRRWDGRSSHGSLSTPHSRHSTRTLQRRAKDRQEGPALSSLSLRSTLSARKRQARGVCMGLPRDARVRIREEINAIVLGLGDGECV